MGFQTGGMYIGKEKGGAGLHVLLAQPTPKLMRTTCINTSFSVVPGIQDQEEGNEVGNGFEGHSLCFVSGA